MSRGNLLKILVLTALTAGCSLTQPYIDRRREAGVKDMNKLYIGASTPEMPAICYNLLTTDYATVKKMADDECRKQKTGNIAQPVEQTVFTCKVMTPNHFYFKCVE